MEYTFGELIDRTAINKVKAERLGSDDARATAARGLREISAHAGYLLRLGPADLDKLIELMQVIHGYIWDRRRFVRAAREGDLTDAEKMQISHYAIDVEDFNQIRRLLVNFLDGCIRPACDRPVRCGEAAGNFH